MRLLYKLAKDGNVDSIIKETCQIAASDEQYLPFKDEVLALAQEFALDELMALIEQYM